MTNFDLPPIVDENGTYVFFDFVVNQSKAERVVIQLFPDKVPKAAENFRCLCTGEKGIGRYGKPLWYKGSIIHRVVPICMVQGGDIVNFDGTGGDTIYGDFFPSENSDLDHNSEGMVGLSCNERDHNSSQFYITTSMCPQLEGVNVLVGKVVLGLDVVKSMSSVPRMDETPQTIIFIENCGQLKPFEVLNRTTDGTTDVYPDWPNDWNGSSDIQTIRGVVDNLNQSGRIHFGKDNFLNAELKYKKIIRYIDWCLEKMKLMRPERPNPLTDIRNKGLLNLAAVQLRLNKNKEVLEHCEEVLKSEPRSGKAFYRRACAQIALMEYDAAIRDLKIAHHYYPNNKQIKSMFELGKSKKRTFLQKQRAIYANLFNS